MAKGETSRRAQVILNDINQISVHPRQLSVCHLALDTMKLQNRQRVAEKNRKRAGATVARCND